MKKIIFIIIVIISLSFFSSISIHGRDMRDNEKPVYDTKKILDNPIEPIQPEIIPLLSPSCIISPIFCLADGGDGGGSTLESMTISINDYGLNVTEFHMDNEDTWNIKFIPEKTEYYKFSFYTYPSNLNVEIKNVNGVVIVDGESNDSYIKDSNGNDEYLLNQGVLYTIIIVNDDNLTSFAASIYRNDDSTQKHPKYISTHANHLIEIDYPGDIDYYKIYNTDNYLQIHSETSDGINLDLNSTLYQCSSSLCENPNFYSESDNYITESGTSIGDMTVFDFGYDEEMIYYKNDYFLIEVWEKSNNSIGGYKLLTEAYSSRGIKIDSNSWVSQDMYPNEKLFQYFQNIGVAHGFDSNTLIGYYKYSYYAIGDHTNIYTIYIDWRIYQYWIDANTFIFGIEFLHADIYKYNPNTETINWNGALQPVTGDVKNIRLTYASDYNLSSLSIYDNASYTTSNSWEDAVFVFTKNMMKSALTQNVYLEGTVAAIEAFSGLTQTYSYQNLLFEYQGNFLESNDITVFQSSDVYNFTLFYKDNYYLRLGETYILPNQSYDLRTVHSKMQVTSEGETDPFYQISFNVDLSNSNTPNDFLYVIYSSDGTYEIVID